jgi:hypothetical protein
MSRKVLADIANTIPRMVASKISRDDLEVLVTLPNGVMAIDLLAAETVHASAGLLQLALGTILADWLQNRLAKARLGLADLTRAKVEILIRTDRVPADRSKIVPFEFTSTATISTASSSCVSKPTFALLWYNRQSGAIAD